MNKINKHFYLFEFFDEETYNTYRADQLLSFLDQQILHIADALRETFGVTYINDWYWEGKREWCGYRTHKAYDILKEQGKNPAINSAHNHGRAIDCTFKDWPASYVRDVIRTNERFWCTYYGVTAIEEGTSHLHVDCRFTGIKPKILWIPKN